MKTFVSAEHIEGKTIEKAIPSGESFVLVFTDGSYTRLIAESDYCDGDKSNYIQFDEDCEFNINEEIYEAIRCGVITDEEYKVIHATNEREQAEREKARDSARNSDEYKQFMILREKFRYI